MHEKTAALQERTRKFASAVIGFCESLSNRLAAQRIVGQLLDSAGSTDSNYRAACRARSLDEFIAKIGVAAEEADESKGWLELLVESKLTPADAAAGLIREADELTAIFVSSRKTAERRRTREQRVREQMKEGRRSR